VIIVLRESSVYFVGYRLDTDGLIRLLIGREVKWNSSGPGEAMSVDLKVMEMAMVKVVTSIREKLSAET
jgi:hypothetical protein